jgi:hypothetical protein
VSFELRLISRIEINTPLEKAAREAAESGSGSSRTMRTPSRAGRDDGVQKRPLNLRRPKSVDAVRKTEKRIVIDAYGGARRSAYGLVGENGSCPTKKAHKRSLRNRYDGPIVMRDVQQNWGLRIVVREPTTTRGGGPRAMPVLSTKSQKLLFLLFHLFLPLMKRRTASLM